jgi:hypothetical protein
MAAGAALFLSGCLLFPSREPEPRIGVWPGGVVRRVNFAEKFLIVEASHRFEPGSELLVMRDGRRVGTVRIREERIKRHVAADLLEGSAAEGDVVERPLAAQPEQGDQTEGRRLGPQNIGTQ